MNIVIIGAGGFGREVLSLIKNINEAASQFKVLGFIDDGIQVGTKIHDCEVLGNLEDINNYNVDGVVLAIGDSKTRMEIIDRLSRNLNFPNIIHPSAIFQDEQKIKMGQGNIICAGNIFTTDISIGNFCIVNLSCTIGHDTVLEDFSSIMPGVNISGGAHVEKGAFIGTGAKLIKATRMGLNSIVGAGAVVDSDVKPNETVVGVPARPLKRGNE